MADGISLAASVGGLLQISAKVIGFLSTMADAPMLARNVHIQAVALRAIFHQLQEFIDGSANFGPERGNIAVDDLRITLTGCVLAFNELEKELDGVKTGGSSLWDRAKWAQKDATIQRILDDLERIKTSLGIMVAMGQK